ncbi:MAG: glycoside hydrolase family 127 protein [Sedimentisphaerales bacterium]|nr:glycoside hydrolase family 127 protein [Sedimentisphaerales bacterium]
MKKVIIVFISSLLLSNVSGGQSRLDYPIMAVPFSQVRIEDNFWLKRLETNWKVSLPHVFNQCEKTGRIQNFAVAGNIKEGKFEGTYFNDSDVYKIIEGAAYSLALFDDPALEKYVDDVITKIAAAQEEDGYLYTSRTIMSPDNMPPGGKERWSNISGGHELYCVGHMYEAAVAYFQATGKRSLLDVAVKNADLICEVFGPGKRREPPGHQEIEIGLVKLYRQTGNEKYLQAAKFFLDERGRPDGHGLYGPYSQDHMPVVEQNEAVGHSVRAAYMYTSMADVAALTGQDDYTKALNSIWENVAGKKLYITGGIGAQGGGEGFGGNYELPNIKAYCETCAAIANAFWNHRMFLLTGESKYIDVLERVIYNGFLSGVSMKGDKFFYPNPLESFHGTSRSPWFGCACCPSNVVRFVPSIPGYAYAQEGDSLYINLFIAGSADVKMKNQTVRIVQQTNYPWEGMVKISISPEENGAEFTLKIRIPAWARNEPVASDLYRYMKQNDEKVVLQVNGKPAVFETDKGYAAIRRYWKKGDVLELFLPMETRRVLANEKVLNNIGRVAIERGPIVYCAEGVDNPSGQVLDFILPDEEQIISEYRDDLLGGVVTLRAKAHKVKRRVDGSLEMQDGSEELMMIPYYAWCHRGQTPMAVWLARTIKAAKPLPAATIAYTSEVKVSRGGDIRALTDQLEPRSSIDHSNPFFHWWPQKGTLEWVEYHFKNPQEVSETAVYWFDDTGIGECRLPSSWRILYKSGEEWKPVENIESYLIEKDVYNKVCFKKITTNALRLEVQLPEEFSAGIHEWQVK